MQKVLFLLVCFFGSVSPVFADATATDPFLRIVKKSDVSDLKYCRHEINNFRDPAICYMTIGAAVEFCRLKGSSLPTVRELAAWAVKNGAKGILEIAAVEKEMGGKVPQGYRRFYSDEADGSKDTFYYSGDGFKPSAKNESVAEVFKTLWSTSRLKDYPYTYYVLSAQGALGIGFDSVSYFPTGVACK